MSSQPKGYVDTSYLDTVQKLLSKLKQLTYEQMHIQPRQKVLDVGCGPSTDTIPLAKLVGSSDRVVGVDYDPEMIAEAKQRALKAGVSAWVNHKQADATQLPFESNYFGACRAERLFQHLLESPKALAEIVRVTEIGGRIVVMEPDWATFSVDANEFETERRLARFLSEHIVYNGYSGRQLYRLFKQQGLVNVSVQVHSVPFTDYVLVRQLMLLDKTEHEALNLGIISTPELDQLHAFWEQANANGCYFASVSMVIVSGRKP